MPFLRWSSVRPVRNSGRGCPLPSGAVPRTLRQEGFDRAERTVVLVEYPNGLLFSLAVNGVAADPREISILDGTGGRIGIEPQEIRGCGLTILRRIRKSMGAEVSTARTVLSSPHV